MQCTGATRERLHRKVCILKNMRGMQCVTSMCVEPIYGWNNKMSDQQDSAVRDRGWRAAQTVEHDCVYDAGRTG